MTAMVGLLGSGGHAREIAEYLGEFSIAFHAVSRDALQENSAENLIPLDTQDPRHLSTSVVAAVGAPGLRRTFVQSWGGLEYLSVQAGTAWVSASATIGRGVVIAPQSAVSAGVSIGDHAIANIGASISHGTSLGQYSTVSPGVHIGGDCTVGDGTFLGIGSTVSHGVRICDGAVIGAGTVVVSDIDVPGVYVGQPARLVRPLREWIMAIP